jgi:murein DD-endopeptidase MepM/ murein hydrolase activator NlpD
MVEISLLVKLKNMLKRIFKKRRILIITDEDITNVPLTFGAQFSIFIVLISFITWVSFSSGKYFTFKSLVNEKEAEVQQVNLINIDLQTKIDNLQGNLVRLNEYFNTVRDFDHNKKTKKKLKKKQGLSFKDTSTLPNIYSKRVPFAKKEQVVNTINNNTSNRISNIKEIISMTGLLVSDMPDYSDITEVSNLNINNKNSNNQGGPNTENIAQTNHKIKTIDGSIHFSENVDQLMYLENLFNSLPFSLPMKRYYISSRYGFRTDPLTKRTMRHYGLDFAGPIRTKIYSTAPGIIKFAGKKGNYGKLIEIDHGFKISTRYAHLSKIKVKKGDAVKRGDLIGYQGNTGRSSGPHLHYEVKFDNKNYNPEKFIKAGQYVF